MSVVTSAFGGIDPGLVIFIQALSVFIGLPFISVGFIILVDGIEPGGIE